MELFLRIAKLRVAKVMVMVVNELPKLEILVESQT
jgi:hypothetical protein